MWLLESSIDLLLQLQLVFFKNIFQQRVAAPPFWAFSIIFLSIAYTIQYSKKLPNSSFAIAPKHSFSRSGD